MQKAASEGAGRHTAMSTRRPRQLRRKGRCSAANGHAGAPLDGSRLLPWMAKLSDRLSNVIVLRRSWESGVTNPMTTYRAKCAVFLDPPYLTAERSSDMYGSDRQGTSDDAARASYKWAVEHGGDPRFRIAYCCHEGDFPCRKDGLLSHAGSAASGAQIASTGRIRSCSARIAKGRSRRTCSHDSDSPLPLPRRRTRVARLRRSEEARPLCTPAQGTKVGEPRLGKRWCWRSTD